MLSLSLEDAIRAWKESREGQYSSGTVVFFNFVLQSLVNGKAVSAEAAVESLGITPETVRKTFTHLRSEGADFDEGGNLTGLVLSRHSTPHQFLVNGRELYAWCALDTLFLPGLIGQRAEVVSTCPATGEAIRILIAPEGVESAFPQGVVLSIAVPGRSSVCEPGLGGGAQCPSCQSMHFFRDRRAAGTWLVSQPDLLVLSVHEAWQLARAVWVEPFKEALTDAVSFPG